MHALWLLSGWMLSSAWAQDPTRDVLWYSGNGGADSGSTGFANRMQSLGGALRIEDSWSDITSLSNYRFVVIARPTLPFTPQQKLDLQAYIDDYGILVIVGDSLVGATHDGILTINDLTSTLGLQLTLEAENFATEAGACEVGEVVNSTQFLDTAAPIGLTSMGDISVGGGATVIETYSVFNPQTGMTLAFTMLAHQGLVLLTSDYQAFTTDTCTLASKQALWDNIWDAYCDRDQDGEPIIACNGFDCDDTDPLVGGLQRWMDLDGDGFGDGGTPAPCDAVGAVAVSGDCDDLDPDVNPDATEVCDGVDNDCSGRADDDAVDATAWFLDFDGDGYGRAGTPELACGMPDDGADNELDCDDGNPAIAPDATESCSNSADDDCDGTVNEGCSTTPPPPPPKGCGCDVGGTGLLWIPAVAGALGLIRRRARR